MVQKVEDVLYILVHESSFLRQTQDRSERILRSEESPRFSQVNGMLHSEDSVQHDILSCLICKPQITWNEPCRKTQFFFGFIRVLPNLCLHLFLPASSGKRFSNLRANCLHSEQENHPQITQFLL